MGENDFYPQFCRVKSIFGSDRNRIKFWSFIAKKNPSFKYFYEKNISDFYNNNPPVSKSDEYYEHYKKFYENGVVEINNFFNQETYKKIMNFFYENNIKKIENEKVGRVATYSIDKTLNSEIHEKIKNIEKVLFGKSFQPQDYVFESIKKEKFQKSVFGTSTLWHPDRFLPSFKLIYFATDVTVDPFEYALKSHKINKQYFSNVMKCIKMENESANEMERMVAENRKTSKDINFKKIDSVVEKLNELDFTGYEFKKFNCKGNTLLIVATHGFHRRSQTEKSEATGIRNNLTVGYYNKFTRFDLIKNSIFS